jgi:hypothetical protein
VDSLHFSAYRDAAKETLPMMDHGDTVTGRMSARHKSAPARGALADQLPARSGAMMQQGDAHGLQSWPQKFIRLVGGHRRPAPDRPAQN